MGRAGFQHRRDDGSDTDGFQPDGSGEIETYNTTHRYTHRHTCTHSHTYTNTHAYACPNSYPKTDLHAVSNSYTYANFHAYAPSNSHGDILSSPTNTDTNGRCFFLL